MSAMARTAGIHGETPEERAVPFAELGEVSLLRSEYFACMDRGSMLKMAEKQLGTYHGLNLHQ